MQAALASPDPLAAVDRASLRWTVYGLLIIASLGGAVGRIMAVQSRSGKTPMLSANDRSRWSNVRALVDHGTYAVDDVVFRAPGKRDPEWYSIDMVKHRGRDGREHYYSSKPTLFNTLLAGPYWVLKQLLGRTIADQPFHFIRLLLVLFNVAPLAIYFVLLAWIVERTGTTDFGRIFVMVAATFGTYLTTFAVTINNHLPAAVSVIATLAVVLQIYWFGKERPGWYALAGLLAASVPVNELPGLSFFCLVAAGLLWYSPSKTCVAFVPASLVVLVASLGTNYLAHGTWTPPYAHRSDGPLIANWEDNTELAVTAGPVSASLREELARHGLEISSAADLTERPDGRGWSLFDPESERRWALRRDTGRWQVHEWDHWYEYEGSYWIADRKQGVDRGEASRAVYAFHATLGHHGLISLTPLWFFSACGACWWLRNAPTSQPLLALVTILLTVVVFSFYVFLRPVEDRNYGGVSCCLRWMLWLIPLWLLCLTPAADRGASRPWLRRALLVALLVSVFSASYNGMNPWSHPWLFNYWSYLGWLQY